MDGFCGEPLWNQINSNDWNRTTSIDFTECFNQTVLIYVPCAFLWISLIYEYHVIKNSSSRPIQWNFLNVGKLLLCFLLLASSVVELSLAISDAFTYDFIYPVNYTTPLIRACTYCLALYMLIHHRKNGIHTSGSLFLFWTLLSVYAILNHRPIFVHYWSDSYNNNYQENLDTHVESVRSYVLKAIEFPLILSELLLAFFADVRSQFISPGTEITNTCPEEYASFPNQMIFQWVTPLIRLGYKRPLKIADMWKLKTSYTTDQVLNQFNKRWEQRPKDGGTRTARIKRNVAFVSFSVLWPLFAFCFVLKLIQTALMFSSPTVLDWLITFMSSNDPDWKGYFYSFLLFLISFMEAVFENQHEYYLNILRMKVKICLMSIVYKKAIVLSNDGRKEFSTGEIVNMMSVDIQTIEDCLQLINIVWSAPIQLVICFVLLWNQLGIATLAGVVTLVLLIPINAYFANRMENSQNQLMIEKDKRSKLVDEILNGIKIIKLYSWERSFKEKIANIRNKEVRQLNRSAYYMTGVEFAFSCAPFIISLALFTTYLLMDENNVLTPNKAFVTLSLLNLLEIPFGMLPIAVTYGAIAIVSLRRIAKYLDADELEEEKKNDLIESYHSEEISKERPKRSLRNVVTIKDGSFSWSKSGDAILKELNLKVEKKSLVAVVGKVGAGKSSLAHALIGEMLKTSGTIEIHGSLAYVPQISWILNSTLRENIVFMNLFDQELYDQVLRICALEDDLKMLANGDLTEIGEKGINLSGGQKQRVSMARACYSNSDIYVLDDPLSAVDAHVGKHIFDKVIGPHGYLKNKTRILITHKIPLLKEVDKIIVLKDGQISEHGSYNELVEAKGEFSEILNTYIDSEEKEELEKSLEKSTSENLERSRRMSLRKYSLTDDDKGRLIEDEKQEVGSVNWKVYKDFFMSMSFWYIFLTMLAYVLSSAFGIATNLWLTAWSEDANDPTNNHNVAQRNKRIGFYAGFGLMEAILSLFAITILNLGMIQSCKYLHAQMLSKVLRAPMLFFDTTPIGRVLNRFTKDLGTVDISLRFNFGFFLMQFFQTIVSIVIFCIETPIFLVLSVPIGVLYVYIQKLYIATSRQLKRLESTTMSPIYSHFSETVQGVSSVRAYGLAEKFVKECHRRIDLNNACFYPSVAATRWLTVRLSFLGFSVVLMSGVFAVFYRDTLSPSLAGLAISFSLSFTMLLNFLITAYSDVETDAVAVERCFEYTKLETEAATKSEFPPDPEWPSKGVVKFKNYGTRYRKDLDPMLKNLTFETGENEKVGICGRTGAGKSTLTLAMFRLLEPTEGTIEIDGVDIRTLGLDDLRSNLTIIPQDPFLYSDTMRMNLDPFNRYTDEELWKALELASLKEFVQESPEGLNKMIEEGGSNLSVGQRQLVCLARALLRRSKVLILDEATAACDFETDEVIQKTIRSEFANNTILTIAHRLNTIIDYDKVIVLENGELREYDSPKKLLENKNSIFYSMAKESGLV